MLFMRSVFGIALMTAMINTKLKRDTWDSVTRDKVGSLVFKTLASSTTNIIQYSVTKYIPLTIISIVINMAPIFVFILAFFILKEVIKRYDLMMMLLTLVGILTVILGSEKEKKDSDEESPMPMLVLYLLLLSNPMLSAGGQVAMRKMGKFNDSVVSWYLQWSVGISSAIVMLAFSQSFSIYSEFDWISWMLAFATGVTSVLSETVRFKAFKL